MTEKIILNIIGMSCVNCAKKIENHLLNQTGVSKADVNFSANEAEFEIDIKLFSKEELINEIKELGYTADVSSKNAQKEQLKIFLELKKLFTIAISLTILIFILSFSNILQEPTKIYLIVIFASIIQFYCAAKFYKDAFSAITYRNYDMNVLVALGTSAAYFYSLFVFLLPQLFPEELRFLYFDGAAVIISFLLLGKLLEEKSKVKANDFLKKLMTLSPLNANLITNDNQQKVVLASSLKVKDIVLIKSGEKIPADGVIIKGNCDIDTSMITGESIPIFKKEGDEVLAGTLNTNGVITVEITKDARDTTLSKIIELLKSAQSKKIPINRYADKIANIFVPAVIVISILTFIIWGVFLEDYTKAILASISVLIISCPCALGLATPMAIISSVSRGAKEGILIKNPEVLEVIKDINYAVFDKTGTITKGEISVSKTTIDDKYLDILGSVEKYSEHPISKAVVNFIESKDINLDLEIDNIEIIPGHGIKAFYKNQKIVIGNLKLLKDQQIKFNENDLDSYEKALLSANSVILASIDNKLLGFFTLEDKLKEYAKEMIEEIKSLGIEPILLTGDNKISAKIISDEIAIKEVYSEVIPTQKYEIIKNLQEKGKVMFVGDGINDAPSIKQADIGITLNSGSDISKDAGDLILVNNSLKSIPKSIHLSIESMKIVKQNLFWAFAYNSLGIPIAAGVLFPFFGIMLSPMYAGIAMSFSSVSVVLNSLRLKVKRF